MIALLTFLRVRATILSGFGTYNTNLDIKLCVRDALLEEYLSYGHSQKIENRKCE